MRKSRLAVWQYLPAVIAFIIISACKTHAPELRPQRKMEQDQAQTAVPEPISDNRRDTPQGEREDKQNDFRIYVHRGLQSLVVGQEVQFEGSTPIPQGWVEITIDGYDIGQAPVVDSRFQLRYEFTNPGKKRKFVATLKDSNGKQVDRFSSSIDVLASKPEESGVPYFCQHANRFEPSRTCGNTSLAMALSAVMGENISPDELFSTNQQRFGYQLANSRFRFAEVARSWGAAGSRAAILSESEMKTELDRGAYLVMQGYFTNSYGHIVTVIGYTEQGFIVHDPNGLWNGGSTGSGYQRCTAGDATGRSVVYSYQEFREQSLRRPNYSVGVIRR